MFLLNHCNDPLCRSPEEFCRTKKLLLSALKIKELAEKYGHPLVAESESETSS